MDANVLSCLRRQPVCEEERRRRRTRLLDSLEPAGLHLRFMIVVIYLFLLLLRQRGLRPCGVGVEEPRWILRDWVSRSNSGMFYAEVAVG